jgi:hypothetical protein
MTLQMGDSAKLRSLCLFLPERSALASAIVMNRVALHFSRGRVADAARSFHPHFTPQHTAF